MGRVHIDQSHQKGAIQMDLVHLDVVNHIYANQICLAHPRIVMKVAVVAYVCLVPMGVVQEYVCIVLIADLSWVETV